MQEIWKDIPGYEGKYQISNLGNVMSLHFKRSLTNKKLLKPMPDGRYGYLKVMLRDNGNYKMKTIHRLVAEAFIPNPEGKPNVNHIDSNPKNNRADNLEWCTPEHNCNYGTRIERMAKNHHKKVASFDKDGNLINVYDSIVDASKDRKCDTSSITKCCRGKRKTCNGLAWKYV